MEKTESSVFLRWEPDQFRRLLLRDAETNRAKESFEADPITLKVKMFTYNNFDEQRRHLFGNSQPDGLELRCNNTTWQPRTKDTQAQLGRRGTPEDSQPRFLYDSYKLLLYRLSLMS